MSIIGSDDREIITSFEFPCSAVTAIDFLTVSWNPQKKVYEVFPSEGSGITIAPNHVLTAAHNAFNID
ncbi:MAG: hypothetical protein AAGE84_30685 [Cyanobacteria bacterium P01_G01_bin.39]